MNYMTNYPDVSHHPLEEIIFEVLQEKSPDTREQLDKMTEEHQQLAILGSSLKEKLHHITSGTMVAKEAIIEASKNYHYLLTRHINFEENEIFPLVENSFNDEDWARVQSQIDASEDPLFGNVVQEQFTDLFKRISLTKNATV